MANLVVTKTIHGSCKMYELVLPFPPSSNTYYRRSKHSTYMSAKGRQFSKDVSAILKQLMLDNESLSERLSVTLELSAPTKRKFDIDNRAKGTLDALQKAGLFIDDEQIDRLLIKRLPVDQEKKGYCVVKIDVIT